MERIASHRRRSAESESRLPRIGNPHDRSPGSGLPQLICTCSPLKNRLLDIRFLLRPLGTENPFYRQNRALRVGRRRVTTWLVVLDFSSVCGYVDGVSSTLQPLRTSHLRCPQLEICRPRRAPKRQPCTSCVAGTHVCPASLYLFVPGLHSVGTTSGPSSLLRRIVFVRYRWRGAQ